MQTEAPADEDAPPTLTAETVGETVRPASGKGYKATAKSRAGTPTQIETEVLRRTGEIATQMQERVTGAMTQMLNRPVPTPNDAFGQYLASVTSSLHRNVQVAWRAEVSTNFTY